ncbi:MAG: LysR family transcriptional regulator [Pseudomonadota bacterium]
MDWSALKFDWNRARAFLVTAEEGSLSAAARALGMTQPTLGRQVSALEDELGVTLFARTGRGLDLTEAGMHLLDHVRAMGEAAGRVALAASGRADAVEGAIVLTASELYAAHLLPPIVAELRADMPGITVEIVASNDQVDLRRREADIAIRNVRPSQPELIARKLGADRARLYATPGCLARLGSPQSLEDLSARAEIVAFEETPRLAEGLGALGLSLSAANFPVTAASHLVQWQLVTHGAAIGIAPEWLGDAEPRVVRVLPDLPPFPFEAWLLTHAELRNSRRVRLVYDRLAERLGPRFKAR